MSNKIAIRRKKSCIAAHRSSDASEYAWAILAAAEIMTIRTHNPRNHQSLPSVVFSRQRCKVIMRSSDLNSSNSDDTLASYLAPVAGTGF